MASVSWARMPSSKSLGVVSVHGLRQPLCLTCRPVYLLCSNCLYQALVYSFFAYCVCTKSCFKFIELTVVLKVEAATRNRGRNGDPMRQVVMAQSLKR